MSDRSDDLTRYGLHEPLVPSLTPRPAAGGRVRARATTAEQERDAGAGAAGADSGGDAAGSDSGDSAGIEVASGAVTAESVADAVPRPATGSDSSAIISSAPRRGQRRAHRDDLIDGRYVVEGAIGRGGMGRVLKVRHQTLGKPFALKLLKPAMAGNPKLREMFYREAKLASSLSHPNICAVLDFGLDPVFGLYMVMELLSGHTLFYRVFHRGRLAPKAACDVMWQVADALHYIHDRGIVHGDIKSENIFLIRTPSRHRVVKLLDFGLARAEIPRAVTAVEGTPEYLAPERIRGAPASQRSDIYALGILFWELVCGERPFTGTDDEIFQQHLSAELPAPSVRVGEPLDERADEIIARATAADPDDRHADVASFMYELRTLMTMMGMETSRRRSRDRPTTTPPGRAPARARKFNAAADVFDHAPVPLAAVDTAGKVRIANRAFWSFVGIAGDADPDADIYLADTAFPKVYPALLGDLRRAAVGQRAVKQAVRIPDGPDASVEVAVVLTPVPPGSPACDGDVIVAVHPLKRELARGGA